MHPPPTPGTDRIRREVYYTGRVQGVGFRATVRYLAASHAVSGYVRNLADGRVEMVAEGAVPELDRFQIAIGRAMQRNILATTVSESGATGEFSSFYIAR